MKILAINSSLRAGMTDSQHPRHSELEADIRPYRC